MPGKAQLNKKIVTVFSVWDQILFPAKAYDVDIFTPQLPYAFAQESFFGGGTPTPRDWWDFDKDPTKCLHPERVTSEVYKDANLLPVAVLEVYGVNDVTVPPDKLASLFYGGLLHFNPNMPPVKESYGFKEDHKILLVELPLDKINQTLDAMINTKLPPGLVNQVVRDYKQIGEYTK